MSVYTKNLQAGDLVMYSRLFCQSIGALAGDIPFRVGTVVKEPEVFGSTTLVTVAWHDQPAFETANVLRSNLILKSDRHKEPA
jgi:hypothetical protein